MIARYELARVANTILLEIIPADCYVSLSEVGQRLGERVVEIRSSNPSFDFAYWSRGTLTEVFEFLYGIGLIDLRGAADLSRQSLESWSGISARRTNDGASYIVRSRSALAGIFHSIEGITPAEAASA